MNEAIKLAVDGLIKEFIAAVSSTTAEDDLKALGDKLLADIENTLGIDTTPQS